MSVWATTGDHCQLPPSVQSREAERRGLTLSLYLRLVGQVSQSAPLRKHANTRGYAEARPIVLTAGEFLAGRSVLLTQCRHPSMLKIIFGTLGIDSCHPREVNRSLLRGMAGRAAALPGHPVPLAPAAGRLCRRGHLRRPTAQRAAGSRGEAEGEDRVGFRLGRIAFECCAGPSAVA